MSSSYSAAELEAMRKEQLKKDLASSILMLQEELTKEHTNEVQTLFGTDIVLSVFADDEFVGDFDMEMGVSKDILIESSYTTREEREELDLSSLLEKTTKKGKIAQELENWICRVDERPVIEKVDEEDRARILKELSAKMQDDSIDIEDKISFTKMRVNSFLQGGATLTDIDKKRIETDYYEYCALCKLLEVKPREIIPYRVRSEIKRMTQVLEKRNQEEYILDVITSIMEEFGCKLKDEVILDHVSGVLFSVNGYPMVDVFLGSDSRGIMFEPVGESTINTHEQKNDVDDSILHICNMCTEIEKRAAEKGVILRNVYRDSITSEEMCDKSEIKEKKQSRRKKKKALKERVLSN